MKRHLHNQRGFTLIEILTVLAVLAILASIAFHYNERYQDKARSVDVVSNWENVNLSLAAYFSSDLHSGALVCGDIPSVLPKKVLDNKFVNLSIGFDRTNPSKTETVLNICATSAKPRSFQVARMVHDYFSALNMVRPGAIMQTSVVSFSVPLLEGEYCRGSIPVPAGGCLGSFVPVPLPRHPRQPVSTPKPVDTSSSGPGTSTDPSQTNGQPPPAQQQSVPAAATGDQGGNTAPPQPPKDNDDGCPPGREKVTLHHGHDYYDICAPVCPPGTTRTHGNNLNCH